MKRIFVVFVLLCLGVVGCKGHADKQAPQEAASINAETFTLKEADNLLSKPQEAANQQVVVPQTEAPAANIVVNTEAGSLADAAAVTVPAATETFSDTPDEKMIQQALKNLGLYSGAIDGNIGPKTKKAIKDFQQKNNLKADGKVGPKTWAAMRKAMGK